ncbi:hypothetical protein MESS2_740012 [Mesorhizobium metallidurans STM 2683]|uniref:Uncharacterized protein n=1 Tax=Mesorhizobium metallidurans STM 2683 TaxID=1297569 RepID=M5EWP7_9HYPH|nr:hypothetical protein MESS2_740012 [Mesorhizobium metallidurans STM 2683]
MAPALDVVQRPAQFETYLRGGTSFAGLRSLQVLYLVREVDCIRLETRGFERRLRRGRHLYSFVGRRN